jgi:peptidyl-prolyl cis-trans isomerase SurA
MIIKLDDKHNGGILPFELAQKEVFDILWRQAVQPKMREYLTKLRTDGFVRVAEGYTDLGAADKAAAKSVAKD